MNHSQLPKKFGLTKCGFDSHLPLSLRSGSILRKGRVGGGEGLVGSQGSPSKGAFSQTAKTAMR